MVVCTILFPQPQYHRFSSLVTVLVLAVLVVLAQSVPIRRFISSLHLFLPFSSSLSLDYVVVRQDRFAVPEDLIFHFLTMIGLSCSVVAASIIL